MLKLVRFGNEEKSFNGIAPVTLHNVHSLRQRAKQAESNITDHLR